MIMDSKEALNHKSENMSQDVAEMFHLQVAVTTLTVARLNVTKEDFTLSCVISSTYMPVNISYFVQQYT